MTIVNGGSVPPKGSANGESVIKTPALQAYGLVRVCKERVFDSHLSVNSASKSSEL